MVFDRDGEAIVLHVSRQAPRHRPRPKNTVLFEPKVEVRTRFTVVVQHEDGTRGHTTIMPLASAALNRHFEAIRLLLNQIDIGA